MTVRLAGVLESHTAMDLVRQGFWLLSSAAPAPTCAMSWRCGFRMFRVSGEREKLLAHVFNLPEIFAYRLA
ncbi:hypothetical protein SAMN05661093_04289 [Kibdelosporangium aridum]|uniref:Uncharacterized protein n=1 Tax=Kibdelosporangium aridum TaxID=2030 RepID=A0A1Y5XRA0_KIBAR|nr:hypothetical protein SAMN05661093_04289 [Kibdelosporangium aridum]